MTASRINYRANIEALRLAGCTHILAATACGSLTESLTRGQVVVPDSYIDRTIHRKNTFFDETSKFYPGKSDIAVIVYVLNIEMKPLLNQNFE